MKCIVTGGAGFIGSNLVRRLLNEGHKVLVLDNLSSGLVENLPLGEKNFSFMNVDISNQQQLMKYKKILGVNDVVFHLAAQSRIQPAVKDPSLAHDNNVVGVYNVLELMRKASIPKIVFSSSSSIYGLKNDCPQEEDMSPDCLNPYAVSKYIGEQYIKTWCRLYGIQGACLRFFNVWGPNEVVHIGDVAPVVGLFFRKILQDKEHITIVGDGQQRRDHTHVTDVVEAIIKASQYKKKMEGEVFNIGTGKNYTILELAHLVLDALELDETYIRHIPPRPAESRATRANNSKAKEWFGWEPKVVLEEKILEHRDYYLKKWRIK